MERRSLLDLTAIDVIKGDVVVVEENDGLADVMSLMAENHVSGLPVVDSDCRCISVISTMDFVRWCVRRVV
jgi:CBS domain-containing protein